ncbi:hypothetical protein CSAL01_07519 [Colletotrichum salicis]|uniref:Uncharacterized protein n=1 Tax=Colletotrichum salicis TaxID=1209931 RepID=A0A135UZJ2_9PEZI|nr:hypothetical protein CSAL01_07519 [Colletotrichum salicis]
MNASSSARAMTPATAKPALHIVICDTIFEQLALRGDHRTLANCALLNKQLSEPASRQLYGVQFDPAESWGGEATEGLWETLSADMAVCTEHPGEMIFPATYHLCLLYIRHLDLLNFFSNSGCVAFPDEQFIAENRHAAVAAQQNLGPITDRSIVAANHICTEAPSIGCFGHRLLLAAFGSNREADSSPGTNLELPSSPSFRYMSTLSLTSLTISFNFQPSPQNRSRFRRWPEENPSKVATWLNSCQALRSIHLFRFPDLVPAVADALPYLHLHRLHDFSTGCCKDFYKKLGTQQLEYPFLAECSDEGLVDLNPEQKERGELVIKAVMAMPSLRDLRLHTYSSLDCSELEKIAKHVPKLETLSFVSRKEENSTWTLRALESFRYLTSVIGLGHTKFSAREILYWVDYLKCHQRLGGFSLFLPSQDRPSWYRGVRAADNTIHDRNDPATASLREILNYLIVLSREDIWRGNDYEADEERMFVHFWAEITGPAGGLQLLRGSGPYEPWTGLMENMGVPLAWSVLH